ncbi:MAG: hypothetical protein AB7D36_05540 [Oscillospiraceae bacterium]
MNKEKRPSKKEIEALAMEIFNFLCDKGMWQDTKIYFNGKSMSTYNPKTKEYYYYYGDEDAAYEAEHGGKHTERRFYLDENDDPRRYFEYVHEPNILSMSFEGPLYDALNYGNGKTEAELLNIFKKYGLCFEIGNAWNLTACPE